jgi:ribosomal protein L37AE/L43A
MDPPGIYPWKQRSVMACNLDLQHHQAHDCISCVLRPNSRHGQFWYCTFCAARPIPGLEGYSVLQITMLDSRSVSNANENSA